MEHLHRLEYDEHVALRDAVADRDTHLGDLPRERRGERAARDTVALGGAAPGLLARYRAQLVTLAAVQSYRGGTWSEDGTIIYAPNVTSGLMRISEAGGEPEVLTDPSQEEGIRSHRWPHLLPGGKAVLFTVQPSSASFDEARLEVLDLRTNERSIVVQGGGSFPRFAATGHMTYVHDGTMFAVPFDPDTLQATGAPLPVIEQVLGA